MLKRCTDTPGWDNGPRPGGPLSCVQYANLYCMNGAFREHMSWTSGAAFNYPEQNCCACGKAFGARGHAAARTTKGQRDTLTSKHHGKRLTKKGGSTPKQGTRTKQATKSGSGRGPSPPRKRSQGSQSERAAAAAPALAAPAGTGVPPCWDRKLETPKVPWGGHDFCPAWPAYDNGTALTATERVLVHNAAIQALRPFAAGITGAQLRAALRPRCAQRLCMLVQIVGRRLYVVAPESVHCTAESRACSAEVRRETPGVSAPGVLWRPEWNPNDLEWHWYAAINMSSCNVRVTRGDWNGPFTRLRMMNALRLLEEAAWHGGVPDTELVLCVNEVMPNAGGWCLKGQQPVFASTTNQEAPLLPFAHWMPKLRDWDLSVWDEVRKAQAERDRRGLRSAWAAKEPKPVAGFRGGIYRLGVYSDEWRTRGARRTDVTLENWRTVGRTRLVAAKADPALAPLLDVHIKGAANEKFGRWRRALKIPKEVLSALDQPEEISSQKQEELFRYTLNVEGHGGWADRLYMLFMSSQLVLAQDLPFQLWYEAFAAAGHTHLALDSNLRNLSDAVLWARAHDAEVRRMVARANVAMHTAMSVSGIRLYMRELLQNYALLLNRGGHRTRLHPRAVELGCEPSGECRDCAMQGRLRSTCGVRCTFRVGGRAFETLHAASKALKPSHGSGAGKEQQPGPPEDHASVRPHTKRGAGARHGSKGRGLRRRLPQK